MKALFTPVAAFADLLGKQHNTQDLAVRASILEVLGYSEDKLQLLFETVQKYDLLNAIHDQMIKTGFVPGATTSYVYFGQETASVEAQMVTLDEAYNALRIFCDTNEIWFRDLDGTISAATVVRDRVLYHYGQGAHTDIDHLSTVLTFIAESIKPEYTISYEEQEVPARTTGGRTTTIQDYATQRGKHWTDITAVMRYLANKHLHLFMSTELTRTQLNSLDTFFYTYPRGIVEVDTDEAGLPIVPQVADSTIERVASGQGYNVSHAGDVAFDIRLFPGAYRNAIFNGSVVPGELVKYFETALSLRERDTTFHRNNPKPAAIQTVGSIAEQLGVKPADVICGLEELYGSAASGPIRWSVESVLSAKHVEGVYAYAQRNWKD